MRINALSPRVNDGYRYWEYSHAPRDDWPQGHGYADWVREKGEVLGELMKQYPHGLPAEFPPDDVVRREDH